MKFHTFCIVAGTVRCNAKCPWCVAGMTPESNVPEKDPKFNRRNFKKACRVAQINGLDTARITGKGEPTMFPEMISQYLRAMREYSFPFIELQTNGILIARRKRVTDAHMKEWYKLGMTHICISVVSHDRERNRLNYTPGEKEYPDLEELVKRLHGFGYNVRMTLIMQKGDVYNVDTFKTFMDWCRTHRIEQVTALPVNKPSHSRDGAIYDAAVKARPDDADLQALEQYFQTEGTQLAKLPWGATIYDLKGQNFCSNVCLTESPEGNESRQLIFFPPGRMGTDWQYEGAMLLDLPQEYAARMEEDEAAGTQGKLVQLELRKPAEATNTPAS